MNRTRVPCLLASMLLASAGPVQAQSPAPWADKLPPKLPGEMQLTLDRYRYFIDCVATTQWRFAAPLFDTGIGSKDEHRVLEDIGGGDRGSSCSYALRMGMSGMLMRGGIAEARYRYLTKDSPDPPIGSDDIAPVPEGATFSWVDFFKDSTDARINLFATCLAEKEPGLVHAFLKTRMMTKDEREAMPRLSRRFGECMYPGEELKANLLTFRPWLGEAAYQRLRKAGRA